MIFFHGADFFCRQRISIWTIFVQGDESTGKESFGETTTVGDHNPGREFKGQLTGTRELEGASHKASYIGTGPMRMHNDTCRPVVVLALVSLSKLHRRKGRESDGPGRKWGL